MGHVLRIGLTGGIGSGKSTVVKLLAQRGAAVIDADAISRQTTAVGGSALPALATQFGPDIIGPDGALDRQKMRTLVYADPDARKRLESIIHPLVSAQAQEQANAAVRANHRCIVFDIPLLVESGRWRRQVDQVLVVDCEPESQIARVTARDGLTRETVEKIMAAQASRSQRLAAADIVVCNEGAVADLEREIVAIAPRFGL